MCVFLFLFFCVFTGLFIEFKGTLETSKNPRKSQHCPKAIFIIGSAATLFSDARVRSIGVWCTRSQWGMLDRTTAINPLLGESTSPCARAHASLILGLDARALVRLGLSFLCSIAVPASQVTLQVQNIWKCSFSYVTYKNTKRK